MPRKQKIHFPGAIYHVIMRGNNKQQIFFDDLHRQQFCLLLESSTENFGCKIHAYCLMTNHIHLIIEVGEFCLAKIMHNIAGRYAQWLNYQLQRTGHLFQGRYKAVLIQDESYILDLCRYIHLNPLRAKLVDTAKKYHWSSHRIYLGLEKLPWLTTSFILNLVHKHFSVQKISYDAFIENNIDHSKFLPSMHLDATNKLIVNDKIIQNCNAVLEKTQKSITSESIFTIVCNEFGVNRNQLSLPNKEWKLAAARATIAIYMQEYCKTSICELANIFCRSPYTISNSIALLRKKRKKNPDLDSTLSRIKAQLEIKTSVRSTDLPT